MGTDDIVRREFLHHTAAGTATLAALGAGAAEQPASTAGAAGSIRTEADGWLVECVGPGTRRFVACRQLIDCTGGGDVVGMLGLARLRAKEMQPGSMLFKMGGTYQLGREQLQAVYVHGADSSTSLTRTTANMTGRRQVLAGRRVSSDRLANSALRVQGSCMAMGQAAGATAALAAGTTGNTPLDVPVDDVRRLLRENQAIVPEI